eukprot:Tamp_17967.p1 GENE.Tamp_17967~~Tamp_17967.p1  ORF type:complete len:347 (-),score=84.62 Tamp_17967:178-1218(-)
MPRTGDHCWLGHSSEAESAPVTPSERAPTPPATGQYREHRRGLVQWMANKANRFGLKTLTIHCAANYLDRAAPCIVLQQLLPPSKFHALAAACLLIAAKFEERPDMVPYISEIVGEERQHFLVASEISQLELLVVKTLDWRLYCDTYLHILDWHKSQGVLEESDTINEMAVSDKMRTKLLKYVNFFADMLVLDPDFCGCPKTIASAAIIATARLTVRVEPVWPAALADKTGFSAEDLAPCVQQMVGAFCRDWPDAAPHHLRNVDARITVLHPHTAAEPAVGEHEHRDFADENANRNLMDLGSPRKADVTWEGDSLCSNAATDEADGNHHGSVGECNDSSENCMLED